MKEQILEKLKEIERRHNVRVLYAAETGSRAWGHNNDNSDYDIRFIYKHNDISRYLVLDKFEDVIQEDDDVIDLAGWDIKKALYLHFKSNPNLREWLVSPVVYIPDEIGIFEGLAEFFPEILKHHYYGLACKTNKKYIVGNDFRDVKIVKKTLYVIRCILAWKILEGEVFPPMNFDELIGQSEIDENLKRSIFHLKDAYSKLAIDEVSDEELLSIHDWIKDSLKSFEKKSFTTPKRNIEDYNARFQEIIGLR